MILKVRDPNWKNSWEYFEGIEEISVRKEDYEFDGAGSVVPAESYNPEKPDAIIAAVQIHYNFVRPQQEHNPENPLKAIVCFCERKGQSFKIAFDVYADVYLLNNEGKIIERL